MSKGLEALDHIRLYRIELKKGYAQYIDLRACLPNEWKVIEKELKALEIIKEKKIDSRLFTDGDFDDYDHYLERMRTWNCCDSNKELFEKCWGILAEEEFDLLKEVLL